jgi:hypothetical protein
VGVGSWRLGLNVSMQQYVGGLAKAFTAHHRKNPDFLPMYFMNAPYKILAIIANYYYIKL